MERKYFTFYRSYRDAVYCLPDNEQLRLFHALLDYALDFTPPTLTGTEQAFWTLIKPTLDRGIRNFRNACKDAEATDERNESETIATDERNESDIETKPKQIIDNRLIEDRLNDKGLNEYGINEYLQSESGANKQPPTNDPIPTPTLENVTAYFHEINSPKSPERFLEIINKHGTFVGEWKQFAKDWSESKRL